MADVLVIDDDRAMRRTLELHLKSSNHRVESAAAAREGEARWLAMSPDLVILDLVLPDEDGITLLERMKAKSSEAFVILITGVDDLDKAISAMRAGAFDYIHKPINLDELDLSIERALEQRIRQERAQVVLDDDSRFESSRIIGHSRAMVELHKQIGLASRSAATLLIRGESGTGKELVARAIHRHATPKQPFVAVNCSAVPASLIESELFGHEKGAFTGAHQKKIGRLELAAQGTLFLDEIGDLAADIQAKLLRVLQEREFERIGSLTTRPFEARIVAATHRNLEAMVAEGKFREDLYYRLKVVEILLPPLRERMEDLPDLIEHFLRRINRELRRNITLIPEDVLRRAQGYSWPGNIRELENRITAGAVGSTGSLLTLDLPEQSPFAASDSKAKHEWRRSLSEVEREHIARVLREVNGHLGRACEVLGISRPTLRKKMEDFGLQ